MRVPSVSSVTVIWLVVPAIHEVRSDTEERTLEPLEKTSLDAVRVSLVILPVILRPLDMSKLPEKEFEAVE